MRFSLSQVMAVSTSIAGAYAETKCFKTSDGVSYTYDFSPSANNNPTFLLIHGFPSTRHDWAPQVTALKSAGYGVIAPDSLGFGDSDKPSGLDVYRWKNQAAHMAELLESEKVDKIIGVGHDWGTGAISRLYSYYPEKFSKLVLMSVGYVAPSGGFLDVDAINAGTLAATGYAQYGYWYFFDHFTAAKVIGDHLESFYHAIYAENSTTQNRDFGNIGAVRNWLNANTTTPLASWDTEAHKEKWLSYFGKTGAIEPSLNPYRRVFAGTDVPDDDSVPKENIPIKVPLLLIGGTKDTVTPGNQMRGLSEPFAAAGIEEHQLEAGHWLSFEKADEVSKIFIEFGKKK